MAGHGINIVYHGIPWYTVVYYGIPWYTMLHPATLWYTMAYHGIHDISRYTMVFHSMPSGVLYIMVVSAKTTIGASNQSTEHMPETHLLEATCGLIPTYRDTKKTCPRGA